MVSGYISVNGCADPVKTQGAPMASCMGFAAGVRHSLHEGNEYTLGDGLTLDLGLQFQGGIALDSYAESGARPVQRFSLTMGLERYIRPSDILDVHFLTLLDSPQPYQAVHLTPLFRRTVGVEKKQYDFDLGFEVRDGLIGFPTEYGSAVLSVSQKAPFFSVGTGSGYEILVNFDLIFPGVSSPLEDDIEKLASESDKVRATLSGKKAAADAASSSGDLEKQSIQKTRDLTASALESLRTDPSSFAPHYKVTKVQSIGMKIIAELNKTLPSGTKKYNPIIWDPRLASDGEFVKRMSARLQEELAAMDLQLSKYTDPQKDYDEALALIAKNEKRIAQLQEASKISKAMFYMQYALAHAYVGFYMDRSLYDDASGIPGIVDDGLASKLKTINALSNVTMATAAFQNSVNTMTRVFDDPASTLWFSGTTAVAGAVMVGFGLGYNIPAFRDWGTVAFLNGTHALKYGLITGQEKKHKVMHLLSGMALSTVGGVVGAIMLTQKSGRGFGTDLTATSLTLAAVDLYDFL